MASLLSGNNKLSNVPSGNFQKASFVVAKTVKGHLPLKVSTKPALCTATKVEKSSLHAATLTMFGDTTSTTEASVATSITSSLILFLISPQDNNNNPEKTKTDDTSNFFSF